jgi:hypothetical protein
MQNLSCINKLVQIIRYKERDLKQREEALSSMDMMFKFRILRQLNLIIWVKVTGKAFKS